jgi:hypothetical protein
MAELTTSIFVLLFIVDLQADTLMITAGSRHKSKRGQVEVGQIE